MATTAVSPALGEKLSKGPEDSPQPAPGVGVNACGRDDVVGVLVLGVSHPIKWGNESQVVSS